MWIRTGEHGQQDRDVIAEVIHGNGYRLDLRGDGGEAPLVVDVGAHIGTFAKLFHARNPTAEIWCCEVCPENWDCLARNVRGEGIGRVVCGAITYEQGDLVLLNSYKPGGTATGGSRVVEAEEVPSAQAFGHLYWCDRRVIDKFTLEQIMTWAGRDWIDVLKLDCEGSEFSILEHGPMERVGFICGEYHGWARFDELRRRKFADWDFGHMHRSGGGPDALGIFHLVNPRGSKV